LPNGKVGGLERGIMRPPVPRRSSVASVRPQPSEWHQIVLSDYLNLYHTPPDSGKRQCESFAHPNASFPNAGAERIGRVWGLGARVVRIPLGRRRLTPHTVEYDSVIKSQRASRN